MRVKRYVVDSMPAALQQIRLELGEQAVILNTKEIRSGGFLGIFGKRQLEVIAAVRNTSESDPLRKTKLEEQTTQSALKANIAVDENSEIMKELKGVKEMLNGMIAAERLQANVPQPLAAWIERLRAQEVDDEVIRFLTEQMTRHASVMNEEEIERVLVDQLRKIVIEGSSEQTTLDPSINLVSFVGPTGVGKTTTIAKIASEQVLNYNRRVGLITTDTYRIAAVEQLKTYANILNAPIETVFSPDGLKKAIKNLKDCDLILMDTAGRNYRDKRYVDEINKYLQGLSQENYLTLSMTTKYRDMKEIIDNFQNVPIDKLIVTKMDETTTYGPLVNVMYHYPYPVAYVTTGQSVPEDITAVDPSKIVNLMLGVEHHERRSSPSP